MSVEWANWCWGVKGLIKLKYAITNAEVENNPKSLKKKQEQPEGARMVQDKWY